MPEYRYMWRCQHCNKIAYLVTEMPKVGDNLKVENVMNFFGHHPTSGEVPTCCRCNKPIHVNIENFSRINMDIFKELADQRAHWKEG